MPLRCPVAPSLLARGPLWGRALGVALTLATAGLASEAAEPTAPPNPSDQRRELQAEINRLRKELRSRENALAALEQPASATLESRPSSQAGGRRVLRNYRPDTPTSSLDRSAAYRTAVLATQFMPGAKISAVAGTGSMEPVFGRDAYLLLEPAPYAVLREGDIVTYLPAGASQPVVHRLVRKYGEKFEAKGDNNPQVDVGYVTRDNYLMRVFGIVYTNPATPPPTAIAGTVGTTVGGAPAAAQK